MNTGIEVILIIASATVTGVFSIIGFFSVRVLNQLECAVKELTGGLGQTNLELAKFIVKTEQILKMHADTLDAHSEHLRVIMKIEQRSAHVSDKRV